MTYEDTGRGLAGLPDRGRTEWGVAWFEGQKHEYPRIEAQATVEEAVELYHDIVHRGKLMDWNFLPTLITRTIPDWTVVAWSPLTPEGENPECSESSSKKP